MKLTIPIGTHEIEAFPEGEALRFVFTWNQSVLVENWTFSQIEKAAETAVCDDDYIVAERRFIRAMGFNPKYLGV